MRISKLALLLSLALLAMAFSAVAASADVIDSTTGLTYNGIVTATSDQAVLTGGVADLDCDSTANGTVDGSAQTGTIDGLAFTNCNPSATVVVDAADLPATVVINKGATDTMELTSEITVNITAGIFGTCTVTTRTAANPTGVLVSNNPGQTTITFDEVLSGNGGICGTTPGWTAVYSVDQNIEVQ